MRLDIASTHGWLAEQGHLTWATQPLSPLGPHEALIQIHGAGVNRADLLQSKGKYPPPHGASPLLGLEVSGHVVALGSDVTSLHMDQPVMALLDGGGYALHAVAQEGLCFPLPEGWNTTQAASLMEGLFTWQNAVSPHLKPGRKRVLIHGGAGGMGTLFIQMAKVLGLTVDVTVSSSEKAELCRHLGASETVIYSQQDFQAAFAHTPPDLIIDCVGGDYVAKNIACLSPGGVLIQIGVMAGATPVVPLIPLMQKGLTLTGATLRDKPLAHKLMLAQGIKATLGPLLSQIKPVIHRVFPMDQAPKALAVMETGGYAGKLVLSNEAVTAPNCSQSHEDYGSVDLHNS